MDFIDEVRHFAKKIETLSKHITNEEATKHSLILPFISLLGYDVFDPSEVIPEFTADVGTKKGEKVDYAIMVKSQPAILVEAKSLGDPLCTHDTQLFRYFATTQAKFAILTNGVVYKFYSDLQEPNKLDESPFLEFNMQDIKDSLVPELKKFHKEAFDPEDLYSTAANLKYMGQIKSMMDSELKDPSEDFCRHFLRQILPQGKPITQNVMKTFKPLIKRALSIYIMELMNEKLKTALNVNTEENENNSEMEAEEDDVLDIGEDQTNGIVTTADELEGFYLIKSILRKAIPAERICLKDNKTYAVILIDNNVRKWVCRLYFYGDSKLIGIPDADKNETRYPIENLDDIYEYQKELVEAANHYLEAGKSA